MSTIHHLPTEVLNSIFEELNDSDLSACQYVCSRWYSLTHVRILKNIKLDHPQKIDKFIQAIDSNPDPRYLNAVKSMTIRRMDFRGAGYVADHNKLFFRFPNLEKIQTRDCLKLLNNLNDRTLLRMCRKLNRFQVDVSQKWRAEYWNLIYKLRRSLTAINTTCIEFSASGCEFKGFLKFIIRFPRLKDILGCTGHYLETFEKHLYVMGQLANIESTSIWTDEEMIDNAERYLAQKTQEERRILVTRLSKMREIKLISHNWIPTGTLEFASRYLTGLTSFHFSAIPTRDSHLEAICNVVLDLFCSAKNDSKIKIGELLKFDKFSKYFPIIVKKVAHPRMVLTIGVHKGHWINMKIIKRPDEHEIKLTLSDPQQVATLIQTVQANVFNFTIHKKIRRNYLAVDNEVYHTYFNNLPLVKDIILDIPASYSDNSIDYNGPTYNQVKNVTLQPTFNGKIQPLLDRYSAAFPNLDCLKLHYYCGKWSEDTCTFQIILSRYTLKRLVVDVTPVKFKMQELGIKDKFFLINVECSGEEKLYKISRNLSSITQITDVDVLRGTEYFMVNIVVKTLCELDILVYSDTNEEEEVEVHKEENYTTEESTTEDEGESDKEDGEKDNKGYDNILYLDPSSTKEIARNTIQVYM